MAQVVVARQKTSIKRLTKTFLTLSLGDVASRVGLDSPQAAEVQLVSMIEEGSIFARISQRDGKSWTNFKMNYNLYLSFVRQTLPKNIGLLVKTKTANCPGVNISH